MPLEAPEELDVAEAAVRRAVGLVGVDGVGVDPGVGNLIGAGGRIADGARDVDRVVGVGAGVPEHLHLLRDDAAVGEHAGLDAVGQRAAAGQQRELLFARRLELDRPAARLAGKAGDERLEVDARLAAEPAADVGDDDAHIVERQLEGVAEQVAHGEGRLRAGPDVDAVAGFPLGDGDVGFHRHVLHRRVGVLALDDPLRFGEALFDVALAALGQIGDVRAGLRREGRLDKVVAREIRMHQRRAGRERVHVVEDRRQHFVFDLDELDRRVGDRPRVGGHRRHRFAEVPDFVLGQNVLVDHVKAEPVREIMAGEDRAHAGQALGARHVDAANLGPRVRALLDLRVEHPWQRHVADVESRAGQLVRHVVTDGAAADLPQGLGICRLKHG